MRTRVSKSRGGFFPMRTRVFNGFALTDDTRTIICAPDDDVQDGMTFDILNTNGDLVGETTDEEWDVFVYRLNGVYYSVYFFNSPSENDCDIQRLRVVEENKAAARSRKVGKGRKEKANDSGRKRQEDRKLPLI